MKEAPSGSLIDYLYEKLGGDNGPFKGITYNRSNCQSIEILQTPNLWGHRPDNNDYWVRPCENCTRVPGYHLPLCRNKPEVCKAHGGTCKPLEGLTTDPLKPERGPACQSTGDYIHDEVYKLMISASSFIDISTLHPFPNGRFRTAIRNAISYLSRTGRLIVIRILAGIVGLKPGNWPEKDTEEFLRDIMSGIDAGKSRLHVFAGTMATNLLNVFDASWNHSKIVAVDGLELITGGQNFWERDYLDFAPVHDINIRVKGTAAMDAHNFLNHLWRHISYWHRSSAPSPSMGRYCSRRWDGSKAVQDSFPLFYRSQNESYSIPVLSMGRLGNGMRASGPAANATETARVLAISQATSSIKIVQQDIAFVLPRTEITWWPNAFLNALADTLSNRDKKVAVEIVLSTPGSESGSGNSYAWGKTLHEVRTQITDLIYNRGGRMYGSLSIAPLRFADNNGKEFEWEYNGRKIKIANHAKVWIIDDKAFCVGSDNVYPANLQEFALLVESEAETKKFLDGYWNKVWQYSSQAAINS